MKKSLLFWGICYVQALICLLIVTPILIFITPFPFCFAAPAVYVAVVAVLSKFALRNPALRGKIPQRLLKGILLALLLIPLIAYLLVLLSVGMGWLPWC